MNARGHRRGLCVEDYAALVHLTVDAAAAQLGVSRNAVLNMERTHGLRFARKPKPKPAPAPLAPKRKAATAAPDPAVAPAPVMRAVAREDAGLRPAVATASAWSADRDARIIATKGRYEALAALASEWDLALKRVQARWHLLRAAR